MEENRGFIFERMRSMKDVKIKQLTEKVWYLPHSKETDRPVLAAIYGDQYTLMMDAGNSPKHAQEFLDDLKAVGIQQPHFLALTHGHWDHTFGTSSLNLPTFAHIKTKEYLNQLVNLVWDNEALTVQVQQGITTAACAEYIKKEYGDRREDIQIALPTVTHTDEIRFNLGNLTATLKHVGGDHSSDSCVLYIEEEKVLFIGDSTSPNIHSPKRYYRLDVISNLLNTLSAFDAEYVIHSHDAPMDKMRFQQEIQEYRDIIEAVNEFGDDIHEIEKDLRLKWNRKLPSEDIEFIQYFINGMKLL